VSAGQTTSTAAITGTVSGNSGVAGTLTFGPYTLNFNFS
jgi:hypothetical protein